MLLAFLCHPAKLACEIESHSPSAPQSENLATEEQRQKKGLMDLKRLPPPWSVKHSSPNMAQGSYPHWSAGNGSSPRQCASPPARSLLNWLSMQWVARVEERPRWIGGTASGRPDSVCFYYNGQLLSGEELILLPPPHPSCSWPKVWPSVTDTYFNAIVQAVPFSAECSLLCPRRWKREHLQALAHSFFFLSPPPLLRWSVPCPN